MKKDWIFAPVLVAVGVVLFLLKVTGMPAHIAVSVFGVAVLIAYTALTKKNWKIPALEIIMRVMYLIAIVTGGMLMKLHGVAALGIIHKAGAALFLVLLLVLYIPKWNCK